MHERSFSQNGTLANSVTTRRKKPSIWSSGDWINSAQESMKDVETLKMPKKTSEINRKLENILAANKPDPRSKLNSRLRNQSFQHGDKPNTGINIVGTSPFSRKGLAENYISQQVKSANNSVRMASPKEAVIETSASFFPFQGIKSAMNSTGSSPCNSPLRGGMTSGESFFNLTRKKIVSIDLSPDILLAKRELTREARSQSTSKNRNLNTSERKPNPSKPKLRIRQKKEFQYGDFGLKFFKPLRSNFAIRIPDRQECNEVQQNSDNLAPGQTDKKNILKQGFYNQLLLSSLIPTDFLSPAKKTQASIAKLFKTLNSKYSFGEFDGEEANKDPKSPQNNKLIFNPQIAARKPTKNMPQKSQTSEGKDRNFMSAQNFYPKKENFISSFLDKNRKCRQIIVLYSELMKQSSLLVGTMSIPIYEKVYKHDEAKKDFDKFLKEAEERLFCPTSLRYAFLVSGESISYLNEVPNDCNILLLSHSALYQFQIRYKEYHLMKAISNEKWNLLLFLLNQQTEIQKIRYLITSSKFNKTVICNNSVDFNQLLNMEFFPTLKGAPSGEKRYSNHIEKAISTLENLYKETEAQNTQNQNIKIDEYNKVFNRISQELKQGEQSDSLTKAGILEKMFNQFEVFLRNNEANEFYIDCLDILLNESASKKNGQTLPEYKSLPAESPKNFQNKQLSNLNVPKLQIETDFIRKELSKLYLKYKAVCSAFSLKILNQHKPLGSKATFKESLTNFQVSSDPMIDRIFEFGGDLGKTPEMSWQRFLKLMMAVPANSVKERMGLFLYLMDINYNGGFSFEEVVAVCRSTINRFRTKSHNKMMDSLADYFAKTVFEGVDLQKGDEIPVNKLREIVDTNPEAVDLLLAFTGPKEKPDDELMLESNSPVGRKPNIQLEEYFV